MDLFTFLEIKSIVMQAREEDSLCNKYVPHYPKVHADPYVWIPCIYQYMRGLIHKILFCSWAL